MMVFRRWSALDPFSISLGGGGEPASPTSLSCFLSLPILSHFFPVFGNLHLLVVTLRRQKASLSRGLLGEAGYFLPSPTALRLTVTRPDSDHRPSCPLTGSLVLAPSKLIQTHWPPSWTIGHLGHVSASHRLRRTVANLLSSPGIRRLDHDLISFVVRSCHLANATVFSIVHSSFPHEGIQHGSPKH